MKIKAFNLGMSQLWLPPKLLLIMRLIIVIMTTCLLQVSASSFGQRITLTERNATLEDVLKKIKIQSGFDVLFINNQINQANKVNVKIANLPLADALELVFKKQPLTYELKEKTIIVKEKSPSFLDRVVSAFAAIDVRGVVMDAEGLPLPGATVTVKGTGKKVVSNGKGEFYLEGIEDTAVLVISFLGYETRELPVAKDMGKVQLVLADGKLEEVTINAGYYTVKERERTGAISKITAKDIEKQPVNNPLMALQGRVPGLQITQVSGIPGGGFKVQIRGQNSIQSGNYPLYIIDGSIYPSAPMSGGSTSEIFGPLSSAGVGANPLGNINPNDIESIEILKDADATAIYGSRGANGVVLITTKKAVAGSTRVMAAIQQGFNSVGHKVKLLNTEEYLAMRFEALKNDFLNSTANDFDINGKYDASKYTDWQDVLIGGTAKTTNASLNITGGNDRNSYFLGGNNYSEGTVFPGSFGLSRASIRANINMSSATGRFKATFNGNFSHKAQELLTTDLTRFILLAPNAPSLYDEYGQLNFTNLLTNPFSTLIQPNNANENSLIGSVSLSYQILENLTFKASLNYASITRTEFLKYPLASYSPVYGYTSLNRSSRFSDNFNNSLVAEPQLNYQTRLGSGIFSALIGTNFQTSELNYRTIVGSNYTSDELMSNIAAAATITASPLTYSQYKYFATFTRLNYSINDKYLINLTARRDGSSRFGSDRQFANFGAIGAGWIFSSEEFAKNIFPFISFGKLRASYGVTGNDQIGNYGYLQLWNSTATYQGKSTITPGAQAPNPDYSWETNRKFETAVQVTLFKDIVGLEAAYFRNRSSNQLLSNQLPASTGLGSLYSNSPGTVQNSGWEFLSDVKIINNKNWHWTSSVNLTIPKNRLLAYPDLASSTESLKYSVNEPLSIVKTYNVSVNKQTGVYAIEDKNDNGSIDDGDRYVIKFLGQKYYGGVQNSIRYKSVGLDFLFSFTKQTAKDYKQSTNLQPGRFAYGSELSNQVSEVLDRWQKPGDEANIQRFGISSTVRTPYLDSYLFGNLSVVDASYIRLRNVSLTYSLPKKILSKLKLENLVFNLQGQNIFTLTKYIGLDPETQSMSVLPPLRALTVGLNLTL